METFLIFFLVALTAICKAIADKITHHYENSIFINAHRQFWDPRISWTNKYKNNDPSQGRKKITFTLFGFPIQIPTFIPFSDGWHLVNSIKISSFLMLPFVCAPFHLCHLISYLALGAFHLVIFTLFYHNLLNKKK